MSSIDSVVFFIVSDIMSPCHHVVVVTYSMVAIVTAIFVPSFVHNRRHRALVDQHNVCVLLCLMTCHLFTGTMLTMRITYPFSCVALHPHVYVRAHVRLQLHMLICV